MMKNLLVILTSAATFAACKKENNVPSAPWERFYIYSVKNTEGSILNFK